MPVIVHHLHSTGILFVYVYILPFVIPVPFFSSAFIMKYVMIFDKVDPGQSCLIPLLMMLSIFWSSKCITVVHFVYKLTIVEGQPP